MGVTACPATPAIQTLSDTESIIKRSMVSDYSHPHGNSDQIIDTLDIVYIIDNRFSMTVAAVIVGKYYMRSETCTCCL